MLKIGISGPEVLFAPDFENMSANVDLFSGQGQSADVVGFDEGANGVKGHLQLWADAQENGADRLDHSFPLEHALHDGPFASEGQGVVESVVVQVAGLFLHQEEEPIVEAVDLPTFDLAQEHVFERAGGLGPSRPANIVQ